MILKALKDYAMQAALACLALSVVALVVLWLQMRAMTAELNMERERNANLVAALETSEEQLKLAREDYDRLDRLLAERAGIVAGISARFDKVRNDIAKFMEVADEQVRQCFDTRLPAAITDRLRGKTGYRDSNRSRAPADQPDTGLPGAGTGG